MRWLAVVLAVCVPTFAADWKRGRHIYLHGAGTAIVNGSAELPASSLPCGSCHGPDGRGVSEGTIEPADVRWSVLSQPRHLRRRYDDVLLRRAIREGVNASDDTLSPVMPRYRMSDGELDDLLAYLRVLGELPDPGLTATQISVATGAAAHVPIIRAYFDDINRTGGIYGRTLRLVEADDEAFAMLSGVESDPDERMPVIAAFPPAADAATSFSIYPDLAMQALALAKAAGPPRAVDIVHDGSAAARTAAELLEREGWTVRSCCQADLLFLLGRIDPETVFRRLDELKLRPRVLLAAPTLPDDVTPQGYEELRAFTARHELPPAPLPAQIATYATVKVLVEGLKRAGRDLTREKLIAALEQLYQFPTGLTPPVTFNRNRRVGSDGYVVALRAARAGVHSVVNASVPRSTKRRHLREAAPGASRLIRIHHRDTEAQSGTEITGAGIALTAIQPFWGNVVDFRIRMMPIR